jgi:5-methyltetrahydropteroyltriglutamate--homocysteine methyltransferase
MTTTPERKIYRTDHPGSFIRPAGLRKARVDRAHGRISAETLSQIEDEAILRVLALQRDVGLDIHSDGEFRRKFFMTGPYAALEGVEDALSPDFERFPRLRDVDPQVLPEVTRPSIAVVGPLRLKRRITGDEVAFLKQHATGPFKVTLPSPITLATHGAWFKPGVTDCFYPSPEAVWQALVELLAGEVRALVNDGVPYIQIDAPAYTRFMVGEQRAQMPNPQQEFDRIVAMENALLEQASAPGVTSAVHICLGTFFLGDPSPLGDQPPVQYDPDWTGKLFGALKADVFQVEYTGRAREGALQALRDVPKGKVVALGLINIRDPRLESQDELLRKIDEAARYFPVESLALISNCGFAGNNAGAFMSEEQQRRKLELLVDTARKVWG